MNKLLLILFLCVTSIQHVFSQSIAINLVIKELPAIKKYSENELKQLIKDSTVIFARNELNYISSDLKVFLVGEQNKKIDYIIDIYLKDSIIIKKHRGVWAFSRLYEAKTNKKLPVFDTLAVSYQKDDEYNIIKNIFQSLHSAIDKSRKSIIIKEIKNINHTKEEGFDKIEDIEVFYDSYLSKKDNIITNKMVNILNSGFIHNQYTFNRSSKHKNKKYWFNYSLINNDLGTHSRVDNPIRIYFTLTKENDKYFLKMDRIRTKGIFKQLWEVKENLPIDLETLSTTPSVIQQNISKNLWSFLSFNLDWQ